MKFKNLLVIFLFFTSSFRLLVVPVSAQNWITFSYFDFNSRNEFAWRSTDKSYYDNWRANIYNYLTYNSSYSGVYGAEVGFYNRSQRKAGTIGVTLAFTKVGKVDVIWWDGNSEATIIGKGAWTFDEPIVVTVRNGYLSVGVGYDTESIVKNFICGTWMMRYVGAKGDSGLTIAGHLNISVHFLKSGLLNLDPKFQHPAEDVYFYAPAVVTEYALPNGKRPPIQYRNHEFPNGTWNAVFEKGKATINFDHNGTDFAHVHFGVFWPTLSWSHPENLTKDYEVEVRMKFQIVNFTDGPWLRAGIAFAMQVNLTAENPYEIPDSKFVELDFFRGENTLPGWNPNVFLVDLYQAKSGELYSLNFPLTKYVTQFIEKGYVEADYYPWSVYIAIETIKSQMCLEVYEFSVYYWSKEPENYVDLIDIYEELDENNKRLEAELEFTRKLMYISLFSTIISFVTTIYFVKRKQK